jgi:hypothetical protein
VVREIAFELVALMLLAACAAAGPASSAPPSPERTVLAGPLASVPPLSAAAEAWCLAHLGSLVADDQRAGDMGTVNRIHAGDSPPAAAARGWADLSPDQLRKDPTFVLACLAADAASSAAPS